jgi:type II secretory pathway component PulJ
MRFARHNYTLLEMVLAVGIFLAVICVVSSGLFAVRQTWEKVKKHNGSLERLQRVDRVIDSTFRNIIPFKWHDENNESRQIFLGKTNSLQMAYQHRIGKISEGGIRFIAFVVRDEKLLALYRKTPIIPWLDEGAPLTGRTTGMKKI